MRKAFSEVRPQRLQRDSESCWKYRCTTWRPLKEHRSVLLWLHFIGPKGAAMSESITCQINAGFSPKCNFCETCIATVTKHRKWRLNYAVRYEQNRFLHAMCRLLHIIQILNCKTKLAPLVFVQYTLRGALQITNTNTWWGNRRPCENEAIVARLAPITSSGLVGNH